ncbi:MFS transporter [Pikeienuella piscinae]|uniref:MFS transporter n=1 Tax=Pikeienuella piscinae TaxID=2748098 RepID=A0A7L5BZP7_9RHOB|nr:MFS transporter [Pikeienuella piscinae]QIE55736.1 MFS transporter [Pikeienuella piscinae]
MTPPGLARTSGFYFFLFFAFGAHLPFWPIWLKDRGLTETEIGTYTAAAIALRVAMGFAVPLAADRAGAPRRALALLALLTSLAFLAHLAAGTPGGLLLTTLLAAAAVAGIAPIADALSLRAAAQGGFAYSTARSAGSAAFLIANILCGLAIARFGSNAALWWIVLSLLPCVWLGLTHPGGAGAPLPRPRLADAAALLRHPVVLLTMLAGASIQGSHAVLYTYGSIHWRAAGIGDGTIGALWAFSVLLEVLLMFFAGRRLIRRLTPAGAMALAGAAGVLRWSLMAADPAAIWLWPLQALHALTFTAAYLGAVAMVERIAPASLGATAQGLVGATAVGVAMAGGGLAAAAAYPAWGAGAYWIAAAFSLTGLGAAALLLRLKV